MVTSKKLIVIRMARKLQKIEAIGRKRITSVRTNRSSVVDKGCFVIYTLDKRRFVIPLAFLSNTILLELFKMSEGEFGLPSDGPITLYILSLVKRGLTKDSEKAVLSSITSHCCSSDAYFNQGGPADQESVLCGI